MYYNSKHTLYVFFSVDKYGAVVRLSEAPIEQR